MALDDKHKTDDSTYHCFRLERHSRFKFFEDGTMGIPGQTSRWPMPSWPSNMNIFKATHNVLHILLVMYKE